MSIPQSAGGPIGSRDDLVNHLAEGSKPRADWRIGTEHEKFVYDPRTFKPVPYEGKPGIRALLDGMKRFGWEPVLEGENIIGLTQNGASLSLEPGGQFELSGAPLKTVHETCAEVDTHLVETREVASEIGVGVLGFGFAPDWTLAETPVMPKGRYRIMRDYMPKVGGLGLDMMFRTCTVQANLDFGSEADMVAKFRTSLALQPICTALFANSPFIEGKPSGFLSARANVWTDTDPDRTGMLDFVFRDGFGFETYANYALDVPMYFAKRGDRYIDLAGRSFRDFMDGKLAELPGERPSIKAVEFEGNHGYTAAERRGTRRFRVNLTLELPLGAAAKSDKIADTIDYWKVSEIVVGIGTKSTFKLLEALAGAIGAKIQDLYPQAAVVIELEKLAPPCPGVPASCGVKLHLPARSS